MRKLTPRFVALSLTFCVGLSLYFAWHGLPADRRAAGRRTEVVGILVPAIEFHPLIKIRESQPAGPSCCYVMLAPPPASGQGIGHPVPAPTPGLDHINHSCGLIVVSADGDRRLKLNSEDAGTLADPGSLEARLIRVFREREEYLAFKPGMERRDDLPLSERIEKTVIIQPSPSLTYGEVAGLIDGIKKTGARPIALQVSDLGN